MICTSRGVKKGVAVAGSVVSMTSAPVRSPVLDSAGYAGYIAAMELHSPSQVFVSQGFNRAGRLGWPYVDPAGIRPLPSTLPNGHPWPKISVVTPSFNQGKYIEQTILSVLHQDYPDVEHLVIDGGSTDETLAVLDRYRDRLAGVVSEKDRGQSHAINKGMAMATGRIVTWLNSDDMLAPGALAAAALALHTSGADMVAGVCRLYRDGVLADQHITSCADGQPLPLQDLLDLDGCWNAGQFFYQPEVLFTRELWEKAGGRVDEGLYYSMDYELWLRFAQAGARVHVVGRPVAHFRVHDEQKTNAPEKFRAELVRVRDEFVQKNGIEIKPPAARRAPKNRLRVVFLNDHGFKHGAGIAHGRLADACAAGGHHIIPVAVADDTSFDGTCPVTTEAFVEHVRIAAPDLVVVGNLHSAAADGQKLAAVAQLFPTAVVLHDAWALTGRCAYMGTCRKHLSPGGCDHECPTADAYPRLDPTRIHDAWQLKRALYSGPNPPALLANSRWMLSQAEETLASIDSASPRRPHTTRAALTRLAFPTDVFRPRDKETCRDLLGLPQDRFLLLFSASSVSDPRKGVGHLVEAMRLLTLPDVTTVCAGYYDERQRPDLPDLRVMGQINDPRRLAMLYSAVDLFVGPSLEEALGQVYIEAAACGTPSVGYPIGGVPEAITDGVTGRVAHAVDPTALAAAILELYLDQSLRQNMSVLGRLHVENEWSTATALQRLHVAIRATGIADRVGLSRKISIQTTEPQVPAPAFVRPEWPAWRALSGFGGWEGPYPQWNLPRVRSANGPAGTIEVNADADGRHAVLIRCFNTYPGQRLAIYREGKPAGETTIPVTQGSGTGYVASVPVELRRGSNVLELRYWQWSASDHAGRAMLIADVMTKKIG